MKALAESLIHALARALLRLYARLPLRVVHALAVPLGALLWRLPNRQREMTRLHLQRCLPELTPAHSERIARESLTEMVRAILEAPLLWFGPEPRLRCWVADADAQRQLATLRDGGQGVIWLCPHLGAWELAGLFCSAHGAMTSLYKPQKGVFDALVLEGRTRLGATLVPTTTGGVKGLMAALRRQEMIGILPDHDPPRGSGVFAPLFGIPAHTTELVTKLAARSPAPIWFCIAERLPRGRGFALHLLPAADAIRDGATGVAVLNREVERVIRRWPQQYWWSYQRYRRRPPGEARFY